MQKHVKVPKSRVEPAACRAAVQIPVCVARTPSRLQSVASSTRVELHARIRERRSAPRPGGRVAVTERIKYGGYEPPFARRRFLGRKTPT